MFDFQNDPDEQLELFEREDKSKDLIFWGSLIALWALTIGVLYFYIVNVY